MWEERNGRLTFVQGEVEVAEHESKKSKIWRRRGRRFWTLATVLAAEAQSAPCDEVEGVD